MKVLKWLGIATALFVAGGTVWYANRTDPSKMIPGRALSGEVVDEIVTDWSFADDHPHIAVETRPAAPHSVTTIVLMHAARRRTEKLISS
ncbi:MAG: hypothetical protein JRH16_22330 [Deltaproteobacteria bacterium]|nr:hypothetical protein [Deltaproteobacteria bacterium]MBW2416056.1 hypothetical protein [Deltaproteobacteria bacterium]